MMQLSNRKPTHPGAVLREDVLPSMKMSISEFARRSHISRQWLTGILKETNPVTVETALKIGKLIGNGPIVWINMQIKFDIWNAQKDLHSDLEQINSYNAA